MKYYSTLDTPRFKIVRPNEKIEVVDEVLQFAQMLKVTKLVMK
jgi:hypothetical protein